MSESKDDSGQKSFHGHKVKILSLLNAHAWVDFLEGPLQGTGRVRLSFAQLERMPEEKPAPSETGCDNDDKPAANAAQPLVDDAVVVTAPCIASDGKAVRLA